MFIFSVVREQAKEAGKIVRSLGPELIVSSDLQRARETAEIVSGFLDGVQIVLEPKIRERVCGRAEGLTADEILKEYGFRMEMTSRSLDSVPGAEPYNDFAGRVVEAFNAMYDRYGSRKILSVCHGGVMRTFYNEQIKPIPAGMVFRNCSIISTERVGERWNILERYNTENI